MQTPGTHIPAPSTTDSTAGLPPHGPKLGLRLPELNPSGAEHSSAGYRYGVCFMQTPTLPQRHRSLRRLHCPQHGRAPRASGLFCTLHQKIPRLCQNMLQIILCYVAAICYIKNDIYSITCFKALKRNGIDVRNASGSIHSAAWPMFVHSQTTTSQPHGLMFVHGQMTTSQPHGLCSFTVR